VRDWFGKPAVNPMNDQDTHDMAAAGYIVTRQVPRPAYMDASLLPSHILTASECIGDMFPSRWALSWTSMSKKDRLAAATKFGLAKEDLPRLNEHMTTAMSQNEFGWPCFWLSSHAACATVNEFVPAHSDLVLLGLGLPRDLVDGFLTKMGAKDQSGVCTMLRSGKSLAPGGTPLGWEPLGYEWGGSFHSWLCNRLEREAWAKLGIRPAPNGFLATEADARAVAGLAEQGNAEPVPWLPFQIAEYKIE
jgi:hypothetical protein